ncbi:DUF2889 domain-containing protein [Pseudomonas sp. PDNC002]|uniref:DUF2889 domain-containing protein n=1 Tax=Pseudomonas sp. PDNC002 TaxID=2811422 RepID=UPI001962A516|nr:DUF2889 domain-containing protein [Pseudomonas sp. PDNC002]QRY77803.1 DUF2889 domain-containing protein [Pseudomonas sp. PDNC002]
MQDSRPPRRLLHDRQVQCRGYHREDGLFEIEGCLIDTKGEETQFIYGKVAASGVLHQMRLVMVLDWDLVIHSVEAFSEQAPTPECGQVTEAYRALAGVRIGAGFKRRVAERVGGTVGCTHLTELLGPMATTAIQTLAPLQQKRLRERAAADPSFQMPSHWVLNTCHAYREEGEAARRIRTWKPDVPAIDPAK